MKKREWMVFLLRMSMGWIFLWPFLDKLFGLGFATAPENAWIAGGSPTSGFLLHATAGPFASIFQALANNPVVDWLFMLGLLGVAITMFLGVAIRFGSYVGALILFLMWLAVLPPQHNPFLDDHIIYGLVFLLLAYSKHTHTLGKWWSKTAVVKAVPWLR